MDPTVGRASLELLLSVLADRPVAAFERIGGAVSFFVKGKSAASEHHFAVQAGTVVLVEGKPATWAVRVGIAESTLGELVAGTLDVPRAFAENRMSIDADEAALRKFAAVFTPPGSALDARLRR